MAHTVENVKEGSAQIISVDGQDHYIWVQYDVAETPEQTALVVAGVPITVTFMERKLKAVDYQAEHITPSGEQLDEI